MTETTDTVTNAPATTETTKAAPPAVAEEPAKPAENGHGDGAEAEPQTNGNGTTEEAAKEEEKKEDPPKEMRSIVLTGFGGYKGVKILKKPEPTAQAGEVLIRVRAW
ncbi:CLUMA_CG016548, isoform A [Clunio marinus]|uniref:CLUMA_CG016548, isoform A n=1 Tax=Clunio marinus TaxID=568069 RepID=A0A1J1ITC0_9DIPT|nr:CLUMA_CG016548, isoform A [Clunio marinus]